MPKVEEITVLNIDNVNYAVKSLSDPVQKMVQTYNEWLQKEADIADELMIIRNAKENLSRQIILQCNKDRQEKEKQKEAKNNVTELKQATVENSDNAE